MHTTFAFPFGEPVQFVVQQDRTPKRIFVLGVYASAVHARWVDVRGKTRIRALAVASEPYIFWRGDGVESIVNRINVPPTVGKLLPAAPELNGPSGIALDELFLHPLGLQRSDAWLCDLVPHSCLNPKQQAALEREYHPLMDSYALPKVTLPTVPQLLADEKRRQEIQSELKVSGANTVVLLGDEPVRWFLHRFDSRWRRLADFGQDDSVYGKLHDGKIGEKLYQVLPLVHPRQAAKLGSHSPVWHELHRRWVSQASQILIA